MSQPGEHTWDRFLHFHRCPECGYVFEGMTTGTKPQIEDLTCPRCSKNFSVERLLASKRKPFFGKPQPPEMDWS